MSLCKKQVARVGRDAERLVAEIEVVQKQVFFRPWQPGIGDKAAQKIHLSDAAEADFHIGVVRAQLPKCDRFFLSSATPRST